MSLEIVANCSKCRSPLYIVGQPAIANGLVVIAIAPCEDCMASGYVKDNLSTSKGQPVQMEEDKLSKPIPEITIEITTENAVPKKQLKDPLDFTAFMKDPEPNGFLEQLNHHLVLALELSSVPDGYIRKKGWEKWYCELLSSCRAIAEEHKQNPLSEEVERDILRAIDYAGKKHKGKYPFEKATNLTDPIVGLIIKAYRNREWEAAMADPFARVREL